MNKALRVVLNILIVAASSGCAVSFVYLISSIRYANREVEDPAVSYAGVFEYMLENRAYGEIMEDYYARRMYSFDPPAGYEDLYHVAEYAHNDFMIAVCDEKGDNDKASMYRQLAEAVRKELGAYEYTAGEVDEMLKKSHY